MAPAYVLEPTYNSLRRRLLAGTWPSGHRLETGRLAGELNVSATPIRDSLNRLAGERLIDAISGAGFQVPRLVEAELVQLIDWHHTLIRFAIEIRSGPAAVPHVEHDPDTIAARAAMIFAAVAGGAGGLELDWAIGNAAARLGQFRRREARTLPRVREEIRALEIALASPDSKGLQRLVDRYHMRRRENAFALVQAAEARR